MDDRCVRGGFYFVVFLQFTYCHYRNIVSTHSEFTGMSRSSIIKPWLVGGLALGVGVLLGLGVAHTRKKSNNTNSVPRKASVPSGCQPRSQNVRNESVEFLFRDNSFYVGETTVFQSGLKFYNTVLIGGVNRSQNISMFRIRTTPPDTASGPQFIKYYHANASFQDTLMGNRYERNSSQGDGWLLLMVDRSNGTRLITETFEGEGSSEFLPKDTGVVQLRMVRKAPADRSQVTNTVFYRLCSESSGDWIPLSETVYEYACPSV